MHTLKLSGSSGMNCSDGVKIYKHDLFIYFYLIAHACFNCFFVKKN